MHADDCNDRKWLVMYRGACFGDIQAQRALQGVFERLTNIVRLWSQLAWFH